MSDRARPIPASGVRERSVAHHVLRPTMDFVIRRRASLKGLIEAADYLLVALVLLRVLLGLEKALRRALRISGLCQIPGQLVPLVPRRGSSEEPLVELRGQEQGLIAVPLQVAVRIQELSGLGEQRDQREDVVVRRRGRGRRTVSGDG